MSDATILREIRELCLYIHFPKSHIDIKIPMIKQMYKLACINNIIPSLTNHYRALLKELEMYEIKYGDVKTNDSKNCVNRMKYRIKAIEKGMQLHKNIILANTYKIDECPCCFENITNQNIVVLECDHLLCGACIKKIININNKCPICREILSVTFYK